VIDDVVLVNYADAIHDDIAAVDSATAALGLVQHEAKRFGPSEQLDVFGVTLHTARGSAIPTTRRASRLATLCSQVLSGDHTTVATLLALSGACTSMLDLFPTARAHTAVRWRAIYFPNGDHSSLVATPLPHHRRVVSQALRWGAEWWQAIAVGRAPRFTPFDHGLRGIPLHITRIRCDAARAEGLGFGAIILTGLPTSHPHSFVVEQWPLGCSRIHNNALELLAVVLSLAAAAPVLSQQVAVVECDNIPAVTCLRREGSSSDLASCLSVFLAMLQDTFRFSCRTHYLQGARQKAADALSRTLVDTSLPGRHTLAWERLRVPPAVLTLGTLLSSPSPQRQNRAATVRLQPPRQSVTWASTLIAELRAARPPTLPTSAGEATVAAEAASGGRDGLPLIPFIATHPAWAPSLRGQDGAYLL
jgi:hypothetical protein